MPASFDRSDGRRRRSTSPPLPTTSARTRSSRTEDTLRHVHRRPSAWAWSRCACATACRTSRKLYFAGAAWPRSPGPEGLRCILVGLLRRVPSPSMSLLATGWTCPRTAFADWAAAPALDAARAATLGGPAAARRGPAASGIARASSASRSAPMGLEKYQSLLPAPRAASAWRAGSATSSATSSRGSAVLILKKDEVLQTQLEARAPGSGWTTVELQRDLPGGPGGPRVCVEQELMSSGISRANLFGKLNSIGYKALEGATVFCKLRGNPYVELVHWLHQVMQTCRTATCTRIIKAFNLDVGQLVARHAERPGQAARGRPRRSRTSPPRSLTRSSVPGPSPASSSARTASAPGTSSSRCLAETALKPNLPADQPPVHQDRRRGAGREVPEDHRRQPRGGALRRPTSSGISGAPGEASARHRPRAAGQAGSPQQVLQGPHRERQGRQDGPHRRSAMRKIRQSSTS